MPSLIAHRSRMLLALWLLLLAVTRLRGEEEDDIDCTSFDQAKEHMHVEARLDDSGGIFLAISCDDGYLLVPRDATTVICDDLTGWNLPECKDIPELFLPYTEIDHDIQVEKLEIPVYLVGEVIRDFSVVVTINTTDPDMAAAAVSPGDFRVDTTTLSFATGDTAKNIPVTIINSHSSGIRKHITLCLNVPDEDEETRAKLGESGCITVTINNTNVVKLSPVQSRYVFTATDQILTFSVGYRIYDIHVDLCFTDEKFLHSPPCQMLTIPSDQSDVSVIDLGKVGKNFSFSEDQIGRHKGILKYNDLNGCKVMITGNEVDIEWTLTPDQIKAHTTKVMLGSPFYTANISHSNQWQPRDELIHVKFVNSPEYAFQLVLTITSPDITDDYSASAMVDPNHSSDDINIAHVLGRLVDTRCRLMDRLNLDLDVKTSPFVAIVTPRNRTATLTVTYDISVQFDSTSYSQFTDSAVTVTIATTRCVNLTEYVTVFAVNESHPSTPLLFKPVNENMTEWNVLKVPTDPLNIYTLKIKKQRPSPGSPSPSLHIASHTYYISGTELQFMESSYKGYTMEVFSIHINSSRALHGVSLDTLAKVIISNKELKITKSEWSPDGNKWTVSVDVGDFNGTWSVTLEVKEGKEDVVRIGAGNSTILVVHPVADEGDKPDEGKDKEKKETDVATETSFSFVGMIAVLIVALIVAVAAYIAYSKRDQDASKSERVKVERLTVENKQLLKQRNELLTAFKKQLKLIDILKRQKKKNL